MAALVIGGLIGLAGTAAACAGIAARIEPSSLVGTPLANQQWSVLFGGGLGGILVGFGIASLGRGQASRASVAFVSDVGSMIVVGGALYFFRARPGLAAVFVAALAAQLAIGLILVFAVLSAERQSVKGFIPGLLVYLASLGGFIFAVA